MPPTKNLKGKKYGRLRVIARADSKGRKGVYWKCRCKCGALKEVQTGNLKSGATVSCGCYRKDRMRKARAGKRPPNYQHGLSQSSTYACWRNIIDRCYNKNNRQYHDYGGRGIRVCKRWFRSFENFYSDMGPMPLGKSIDRKDNSLGYNRRNCRWATRKEQQRNRRGNVRLTFDGRTQTMSAWAEESGILGSVLRSRIFQCGWSIHKALTTKVRTYGKRG